jgi:leucyl-tRNA---protein transferase
MTDRFPSMFAEVQSPDSLTAVELDAFLERGWFRMGQTIFTTNFLNFKGHFYSAVWLRLDLATYTPDRTEQKLLKANSRFRVEIGPMKIDEQREHLYSIYRESVVFDASTSIHQLMFRESLHNIFSTHEVTVYDGDKLIACGFFDLGKTSAAGISSFYHPDYKKHSLGKFLIYSKIRFCREQRLKYFYPGYFVPGYASFDYKLAIGRSDLYFLDYRSQKWQHIADFDSAATPLVVMSRKLVELQEYFKNWGIDTRLLKYDFFDANLMPGLQGIHLFDAPVFLYPLEVEDELTQPVIIYDLRASLYRLIKCTSVWRSNYPGSEGIYSSNLLKPDVELFTTDDADEMVAVFVSAMSSKTAGDHPEFNPNKADPQ